MPTLWSSDALDHWQAALDQYDAVVAAQGVERLVELDRWYRDALPAAMGGREPAHVTHAELVRLTEWKMARGVWRARNLVLVRGNEPALVAETSARALAAAPHPTAPIAALAELAGVGPATASAVAAAAAPSVYPFFDELVAAQLPEPRKVTFTLGEYARYAEALRARAGRLGDGWTPATDERALWAHVGGKAGLRASR
jgi:nucleoid-associated protein YgaU